MSLSRETLEINVRLTQLYGYKLFSNFCLLRQREKGSLTMFILQNKMRTNSDKNEFEFCREGIPDLYTDELDIVINIDALAVFFPILLKLFVLFSQ